MNRLLFFLIFSLGTVAVNQLHAQDLQKKDYISSGYYQLVYEADIAHLEGNDNLAYAKLQEAEKTCPLLNQSLYEEMDLYSILLMKNNHFDKAIFYMERLATEYGAIPGLTFSILEEDSVLTNNLLQRYPAFYDSILPAIIQKQNKFYTPERKELIAELTDILRLDQEAREGWETKSKGIDSAAFHAKLHEIDSLNAIRFFEIVKKYGYPNRKQYGSNFQSRRLPQRIDVLLMHIQNRFNLEAMILQSVREGECEPLVFGSIIDKGILEGKWGKISLYGIWDNVRENEIIDILHLDDRRIAIGMPTWEMQKKRNSLIK